MTDFERIKYYYDKGWASKSQVKQYVVFGKITAEQYETITSEPYTA